MDRSALNQAGSFTIGLVIFLMITASIVLGFVVGAITDPRRNSDLRAAAFNPKVKPVIHWGSPETCAQPIRWYTIDLICR